MLKYFVVIILLLSRISFAQNAEDVLKSIQNKYNNIKDFSASVTQGSVSGTIYFKKDDKFKFDLTNMVIVSDGKTSWTYNKASKQVVIDNKKENLYSFNYILNSYPSLCKVSYEKSTKVLTLTPKSKNQMGTVKLWVNQDYLVQKIVVEKGKNSLQISLSNYKINQNLSDGEFTFTPPKGSKIVDLRE